MDRLRRYLPLLFSLAACGSEPAGSAGPEADAAPPLANTDGAVPSKADAGPDARVLGPAIPVSPDKLGCEGGVRVDGPVIDATGVFTIGTQPDRAFVSFTDGTFGTTAYGNTVVAKRFDDRLRELTTHPIAPLELAQPGISGNLTHFRDGSSIGFVLAGRTSGSPSRHVASIFGYDFETQKTFAERYDATVNGMAVSAWSVTAGATESFLWARLAEGATTRGWRRTLRAGATWQSTGLETIPTSQWEEGGKTHVLHSSNRDAVIADDGTVERDVQLDTIANTTDPCAFGTVFRGGSGIVTVRQLTRLPCSDPGRDQAPYELWMHALGDATGRKLGTVNPNEPNAGVYFLLGVKSDAMITTEGVDGNVTARLQRLDARMGNLAGPVEVTRPTKPVRTSLVPVAGGYFWFVQDTSAVTGAARTSAYHLVCAP